MIYVLLPHDNAEAIRVFSNFGMMEQILLRQGDLRQQWHLDPDWCSVVGYELSGDEYAPIWVWHLGPAGGLIREPFNQ
jgi:hypothetical protein